MSNNDEKPTLEMKRRALKELADRGWGMPVDAILLNPGRAPIDTTRFPHKCPRCGAPAYVGLSSVECSAGCG